MQEHIIYRNCIIEIKHRFWWWSGKPYSSAGKAMNRIDMDTPKINWWLNSDIPETRNNKRDKPKDSHYP